MSLRRKKKKIEVKSEGRIRAYKAGESCQPENCSTSCGRKGRAHYHLKECPGKSKCPAQTYQFVKHSNDKFHPFESKTFDLWLCKDYWNSMQWQSPVDDSLREEISQCNYICTHSSHKEENSFCNESAWHKGHHKFICKHTERSNASIIDIVFCCDSTSSMGPYIKRAKDAVQRIILKAQELLVGSEESVKFGFVAYRDHPPEDNTYVTIKQDLCDQEKIKLFISSLSAQGGGDGPEAVLDGLNVAIQNMSYRKDSLRFLFHIADAPPHGMEYTSGKRDGFPLGCPCGLTIDHLAVLIKKKNIKYKLLKIGTYPNTMASIFKSKIENFEEYGLESAIELDAAVVDIVARDLKSDEQDFLVNS